MILWALEDRIYQNQYIRLKPQMRLLNLDMLLLDRRRRFYHQLLLLFPHTDALTITNRPFRVFILNRRLLLLLRR